MRAAILQSDLRRKILAGIRPTTHAGEEYETGLYSPEMKQRTYRSLLEQSLALVREGHSVIVDATFSRRKYRSMFVDAMERLGMPYYFVEVTAPDTVIRQRLAKRAQDPKATSDADLSVYLREREAFEPLDEVPDGRVYTASCKQSCVPEELCSELIDKMIAAETALLDVR